MLKANFVVHAIEIRPLFYPLLRTIGHLIVPQGGTRTKLFEIMVFFLKLY
jgi:hypothetical protein